VTAAAGAITEIIVPIAYSVVGSIATGPDGAMWFTTIDTIGRITTAGVFTLHIFPTFAGHDSPFFTSITAGPDGALWSVEYNGNRIGRLSMPTATMTVSLSGTGTGSVVSSPAGIACQGNCTHQYLVGTGVALSATVTSGSTFTGWLGECTGTGPCNIITAGPTNVSATFAPSTALPLRVDVDENSSYGALTDGLIMLRYLFGLTGSTLTSGALGSGATLTDPAQMLNHLNDIRPCFDVDGNGQVDALSDGLMSIRYLFG